MVSDPPIRRKSHTRRRKAKQPRYLWFLQLIIAVLTFVYLIEIYTLGINSITPILGIAAIILSFAAAFLNLLHQSLPLILIDVVLAIVLIVHMNNLLF